jgi:general secretion pathway protein B
VEERRDVAVAPLSRAPAAAIVPQPQTRDVPVPPPTEPQAAAVPPAGVAASPAAPPAARPAGNGADRVVRIHELPPDVRGRLPQMSIGGSRYSADPAKRFLIVNGLLLREQQPVTPEVMLEEIRLRGAVLRIGEWRFAISY